MPISDTPLLMLILSMQSIAAHAFWQVLYSKMSTSLRMMFLVKKYTVRVTINCIKRIDTKITTTLFPAATLHNLNFNQGTNIDLHR